MVSRRASTREEWALLAFCVCATLIPSFEECRVYLRSQKCWDIRPKAPDARRMSAALLGGMQANATRQMGLLGRIEQRWGVFRYTLGRRDGRGSGDPPEGVHQAGQIRHDHGDGRDVGDEEQGHHHAE